MSEFQKVGQFKSVEEFQRRCADLSLDLPMDDRIITAEAGSPLAAPLDWGTLRVGNRWCIQPMEGWDANHDGSPSPLTERRWQNFGRSGAKLIWGGEAAAVVASGRANPRQTLATRDNQAGLGSLLQTLRSAHREVFGDVADLVVGLQLTHSGRFCKPEPDQRLRPRIAYHHPLLDRRFGIDSTDDSVIWTDGELDALVSQFVDAARVARDAGFQFVDVKACHGYLLHEFLSARRRPGIFGGDFAGRTRLLRTIIQRIRSEIHGLDVVVRLSAFDSVPFEAGQSAGVPSDYAACLPYDCGFGLDPHCPTRIDLTEPIRLLQELAALGVIAVNVSGGSPYYNPHIQRPAAFPPSDGYLPPEDPLVGVARQIDVARRCKQAVPKLLMVGTGYSYLQDYLPHVAQAVVRAGWIDTVGLGRMVLSYPELPTDCLQLGRLQRKKICRTFSDCTTGPRRNLVSGCYPLDPFYKNLPEAEQLRRWKHS